MQNFVPLISNLLIFHFIKYKIFALANNSCSEAKVVLCRGYLKQLVGLGGRRLWFACKFLTQSHPLIKDHTKQPFIDITRLNGRLMAR